MKTILEDISFAVGGFFLVLYVCLVLLICKLLGVDLEDDFYED